ncbi:glycosyltransferase [Neiella marina]|uniref:Glycosyltransferase n=1 Tax=Neiella holothuriorum TaxID=2870530 RepID=A0ABS7EJG3_9GAMM|nr:glycosyltransferase family 2 protein [Neiella holothuriorum]MBW8192486.1 glycosyltransferase [Neiella holothuriorum]
MTIPTRENKPLVSVIVPVYNTEQYLVQCLQSLLKQSLTSIEIVVVNDASPDQCAAILARYQAQFDGRLIVIEHDRNRGLASARNTGLAHANGQYIGFVDSDDYVAPDMYEHLVRAALTHQAEVVSCGMALESGEHRERLVFKSAVENTSACNKLFSRRLIHQAQLRFADGQLFEDEVFVLKALMTSSAIHQVAQLGYIYRANPNGICRSEGQDSQRLFARMRTMTDLLVSIEPQQQENSHQQLLLLALCRHAMLQLNTKVSWHELRGYWLYTHHLIVRYGLDRHHEALADNYFVRCFKVGSEQLLRLWMWQRVQGATSWLKTIVRFGKS